MGRLLEPRGLANPGLARRRPVPQVLLRRAIGPHLYRLDHLLLASREPSDRRV